MSETPKRPPTSFLVMGEPGSRKSTFAATFPKPMLVSLFDPPGKDSPFEEIGRRVEVENKGIPAYHVMDKRVASELLVRVEMFHDWDATRPTAWALFNQRLASLPQEMGSVWKTWVIDSTTFLEEAVFNHQRYVVNPNTKEPRQWYAGVAETMRALLWNRVSAAALRLNVVVLTHIDTDKDELQGSFVRNPALAGKLRGRVAAGYPEFYRALWQDDDKGGRQFLLQTSAGQGFACLSQRIHAPNPCLPDYAALWTNYDKESMK